MITKDTKSMFFDFLSPESYIFRLFMSFWLRKLIFGAVFMIFAFIVKNLFMIFLSFYKNRFIFAQKVELEKKIWTDFCHAIFNMKEFMFLTG